MEISEKKIIEYFNVSEGVVTSLQRDFLLKSEEWIDELTTFSESIDVLLECTVWGEQDKNLTSFFRDMVLDIEECVILVEENSSLVRRSIPNELQIKAVVKHRLIVLQYLRSCFNVLRSSANEK